jgi:hypothetical protein
VTRECGPDLAFGLGTNGFWAYPSYDNTDLCIWYDVAKIHQAAHESRDSNRLATPHSDNDVGVLEGRQRRRVAPRGQRVEQDIFIVIQREATVDHDERTQGSGDLPQPNQTRWAQLHPTISARESGQYAWTVAYLGTQLSQPGDIKGSRISMATRGRDARGIVDDSE